MFWLVKIWQVSSCGKFMQRLETCLLIAEADRVLCHLVMFLTVFFCWKYKMKSSCYQDSSVIHGWFVYCGFVWEMCYPCFMSPQINRKTSLHFTCFALLFRFFISLHSFSSRSLLITRMSYVIHKTRFRFPLFFFSVQSLYVTHIPSEEKCRPWHVMKMWKKNHDSKLEG